MKYGMNIYNVKQIFSIQNKDTNGTSKIDAVVYHDRRPWYII